MQPSSPRHAATANLRLTDKQCNEGQHVPVDEGAAAASPPSAVGRAMGAMGNLLFYGGLFGAIGFQASTYIYSIEDVQKMNKEAQDAAEESGGPVSEAYAWFMSRFCSAREWYAEKISDFTGAPPLLPFIHYVPPPTTAFHATIFLSANASLHSQEPHMMLVLR